MASDRSVGIQKGECVQQTLDGSVSSLLLCGHQRLQYLASCSKRCTIDSDVHHVPRRAIPYVASHRDAWRPTTERQLLLLYVRERHTACEIRYSNTTVYYGIHERSECIP